MKYVGILAVTVIILYVYRNGGAPSNRVEEANREFAATAPATPAAAPRTASAQPAAPSSNLRRPIDTTRSVLKQVKARNGEGEF
jgi:hypothetical protein